MVKYKELFKENNEDVDERYILMMERIDSLLDGEDASLSGNKYKDYFIKTAQFIKRLDEWKRFVYNGGL